MLHVYNMSYIPRMREDWSYCGSCRDYHTAVSTVDLKGE